MVIIPTPGCVGPPWWGDKTVFLVGGGPSLAGFDLKRLCGLGHLCGVNESMPHLPVAAGVSIDLRFVKERWRDLTAFAGTTQLYLSMGSEWWREVPPVAGAINLRNEPQPGLSIDPAVLRRGHTSGYAALNLAVLKRAKRIVLLGYDYGLIDGRHHYHDAYTWRAVTASNWATWARDFVDAAAACRSLGVDVVNASPHSAIECFPKMSIEDALRW